MDALQFDVLIIGGGQAGPPLAGALAKAGKRVGLAERKDLGGSCINFGCTPTKAAIASARLAHLARRATEFGLRIGPIEVDFPAVLKRAREIAEKSRAGLDAWLGPLDNPTLLRAHAKFLGREGERFKLAVGDREVVASEVVIDTGTRSLFPPIEGLDRSAVIHAGNWLRQTTLPARLAVIGGGYIGLEMAQFYRRLGSEVVVIEGGAQIAGHEDPDIAAALQEELEKDGIDFRLSARVTRIDAGVKDDRTLHLTSKIGPIALQASDIFVATGRQPNTDDLGLDQVGVELSKGYVAVDERLATNIAGIWAAGDVRGGPMFTHTAWDDYRILESQLVGDKSRTTQRIVPYGVFTDPELGRVGMTETEARNAGHQVKIGRFELRKNGKAVEVGETAGFIKVVVDGKTDRLLGAAVLGAEAAELVHVYIDLMNADAPYRVIRDAVYIHPTLAEAVQSAVAAIQ